VHDIRAPIDWYVWQGYWRDGQLEAGAKFNCGPASVAMALRYSTNNALRLTPDQIRDLIPRVQGQYDKGTYPADLAVVLDRWQVPWREVTSMDEIAQAIAQNHIVIVPVDMDHISDGRVAPAVQACSQEQASCIPISGRFNDYQGRHVVVAKGIVQDSQNGQKYVVVYDPNVWDGNTTYYYRNDSRYPRGLNRLYAYEEFERAFQSTTFHAIEVLATPWSPVELPDAAASTGEPPPARSAPFWCYQAQGEVAHIHWCQ
jgi:hypothetical protein